MAILQIREKIEAGTSKLDRFGFATYTRLIQVISSDYRTRQGTALQAVRSLVDIGDAYTVIDPADNVTVIESDSGAFVTDMSAALASQSEDGCQWDVTVSYGPAGGEFVTFPSNPLDHPIELTWGSERTDVAIERDKNGNAITNSSGDFFEENPPVIEKYKIILTIMRNEASFSPILAQTWKGTINGATWTVAGQTFAAGLVKCLDITSRAQYHPDCGWYWPVQYDFVIDPDNWKFKPLDRGVRKLSGGNKVAIRDGDGQVIPDPVMLDGSGGVLASGGTPVVLNFDIYPASNFDLLNFDFTNAPGY